MRRRLLAATAALLATSGPAWPTSAAARGEAPVAPSLLRSLDAGLEHVVAKVSPAVVQVLVSGYGPADVHGAGGPVIVRQHALGSGVVVEADGFIVTNAHVVNGAQRVRVLLPPVDGADPAHRGRRLYDARVLGIEPDIDLAVLKIDAKGLPTIALGKRDVRPGQLVFAVGSPEGLASTVTMGVVSSVARQPDVDRPMVYIQTDAPINPGNSGGPLVDTDGDVVGINTFIVTQGGGSEGLGFAIPSAVVRFVYESLRRYGHVPRTSVGMSAQAITPGLAQGLSLPQDWGVVVADVASGGPAERAGLAAGDVLVSVDGRSVDGMPALGAAFYVHVPRKPVVIVVRRGKGTATVQITPEESSRAAEQLADLVDVGRGAVPRLGVVAVTLDDRIRALLPSLRERAGAVVVGRTLEAAQGEVGLEPGDVIHAVNRTAVDSVEALRKAVLALPEGSSGVLRVERHGELTWLELEVE